MRLNDKGRALARREAEAEGITFDALQNSQEGKIYWDLEEFHNELDDLLCEDSCSVILTLSPSETQFLEKKANLWGNKYSFQIYFDPKEDFEKE